MGRIQQIAKLMQEQKWDMENKHIIKPRIITPKKQRMDDDEVKEKLICNLSLIGLSDVSIAHIFKISTKTVYRVRTKVR